MKTFASVAILSMVIVMTKFRILCDILHPHNYLSLVAQVEMEKVVV
jgi:hypothetical protein